MKYKITEKILRSMLKERKKSSQIIRCLEKKYNIYISERQWRYFVRDYNDEYYKRERYIASNHHGYILTTKKKFIKQSAIKNLKVGIAMIRNAKEELKELENKKQLSFLPEEADIYDIAMKLEL